MVHYELRDARMQRDVTIAAQQGVSCTHTNIAKICFNYNLLSRMQLTLSPLLTRMRDGKYSGREAEDVTGERERERERKIERERGTRRKRRAATSLSYALFAEG